MIEMDVEKHFDLGRIKLDLTKELNEGIDIIALDIQKGIDSQKQFGKPIVKNEDETLERKRKRGWGEKSLIEEKRWLRDSGKMVKGKASRKRQRASLLPKKERIDIAYWLQETGVRTKHGIKHYLFWGISENAEKEIIKRVEARILMEIRRA
jgi:hypothetical protein